MCGLVIAGKRGRPVKSGTWPATDAALTPEVEKISAGSRELGKSESYSLRDEWIWLTCRESIRVTLIENAMKGEVPLAIDLLVFVFP